MTMASQVRQQGRDVLLRINATYLRGTRNREELAPSEIDQFLSSQRRINPSYVVVGSGGLDWWTDGVNDVAICDFRLHGKAINGWISRVGYVADQPVVERVEQFK